MARINVYVPDDLAAAARRAGLNVSALTQRAVSEELARGETDRWLERVSNGSPGISHDDALAALDEAREELGG